MGSTDRNNEENFIQFLASSGEEIQKTWCRCVSTCGKLDLDCPLLTNLWFPVSSLASPVTHLSLDCPLQASTLTQVLPIGAVTDQAILRTATEWQHQAINEAHHWPSQSWPKLSLS